MVDQLLEHLLVENPEYPNLSDPLLLELLQDVFERDVAIDPDLQPLSVDEEAIPYHFQAQGIVRFQEVVNELQ